MAVGHETRARRTRAARTATQAAERRAERRRRRRNPRGSSSSSSTRSRPRATATSASGFRARQGASPRALPRLQRARGAARGDSEELARVSTHHRARGPDERARDAARRGRRLGRQMVDCDQRDDRRPRAADDRGRARHRRGRRGRPLPEDGAEDRGAAAARRVPPHRAHRQHDGRPARRRSPPR